MFAHDTTLYLAGKSISEIHTNLEPELLQIVSWVERNRLVLNVEKTKGFVIGTSRSQ